MRSVNYEKTVLEADLIVLFCHDFCLKAKIRAKTIDFVFVPGVVPRVIYMIPLRGITQ